MHMHQILSRLETAIYISTFAYKQSCLNIKKIYVETNHLCVHICLGCSCGADLDILNIQFLELSK